MPNWIEEYAKAHQREVERKKKQEEANKAVGASITANLPILFEALHRAVEKDVSDFNEYFNDVMKNLSIESIGSERFQVVRKYAPDFLLSVKLDGKRIVITWEITQDGQRILDVFEIGYNGNGGMLLDHGTPITFDKASRKLIEPAFKGIG